MKFIKKKKYGALSRGRLMSSGLTIVFSSWFRQLKRRKILCWSPKWRTSDVEKSKFDFAKLFSFYYYYFFSPQKKVTETFVLQVIRSLNGLELLEDWQVLVKSVASSFFSLLLRLPVLQNRFFLWKHIFKTV